MKALNYFKQKDKLALTIILVIAFVLRFGRLNFQSLWLDELHTMREADPTISLSAMFEYLRCCDQHPPLFFLLERILFTVFGHNEFVARSLSALIGVLSVWALYLLGKELLNKSLGLIAAALTCINYFNIHYSQEARGYILAFLLSALSYLFFIRLIRYLRRKDMWLYALFTLLLMYTHYYGLLITCSQFFVAFILLFAEKEKRKTYFRSFLISGVVLAVGYAPWLPFIRAMSDIKSFWISPIPPDFFFTYFKAYFGDSAFLVPLIMILLISYTLHAFRSENLKFAELKLAPLPLSFVIVFASVFITYILPYLRSILVVPMLFDRYTIVILPLFLLVLAYGLELIRNQPVKYMILGAFILLSLMDLVAVKHYYTSRGKTQFREMNQFIASVKNDSYPVLDSRTGWQEEYYLRHFGSKAEILMDKKEDVIDSFLRSNSPKYKVKGFWLMDAHGAAPKDGYLSPALKAGLDSAFVLTRDGTFVDAWAQLYLLKSEADGKFLMLSAAYGFPKGSTFNYNGQNSVVDWGGNLQSDSFALKKGEYEVVVTASGTPAKNQFPHLIVYVDGQRLGDYYITQEFEKKSFSFTMPAERKTSVKIVFDNDFADPVAQQDRNAFISNILFMKK